MDQKQNINPETQATDLMDLKSRCSGDTQELGSCGVPRGKKKTSYKFVGLGTGPLWEISAGMELVD